LSTTDSIGSMNRVALLLRGPNRQHEAPRAQRDDGLLESALAREDAHAAFEQMADLGADSQHVATDSRERRRGVVAPRGARVERSLDVSRKVGNRVELKNAGAERGRLVTVAKADAKRRDIAQERGDRDERLRIEHVALDRRGRERRLEIWKRGERRPARLVAPEKRDRLFDLASRREKRGAGRRWRESASERAAALRDGVSRDQFERLRKFQIAESVSDRSPGRDGFSSERRAVTERRDRTRETGIP
jgi:hypothetical protein